MSERAPLPPSLPPLLPFLYLLCGFRFDVLALIDRLPRRLPSEPIANARHMALQARQGLMGLSHGRCVDGRRLINPCLLLHALEFKFEVASREESTL